MASTAALHSPPRPAQRAPTYGLRVGQDAHETSSKAAKRHQAVSGYWHSIGTLAPLVLPA